MRFRNRYRGLATRPRRPAARKLARDEQENLLVTLAAEVQRSSVLTKLGCRITSKRDRFYVDRIGTDDEERWGRITPLEENQQLILERERRANQWYGIAKGSPKALIHALASDKAGTFHGMGQLDPVLREASADPSRLDVIEIARSGDEGVNDSRPRFAYRTTGLRCTAQEALHLYFRIPLDVLIHPRGWYIRHRTPEIVEHSADRSRVLVRFYSASSSGEPIAGTCLYVRLEDGVPGKRDRARDDPAWGAYTIRPNAGETIESAEAWIVKRKWKPW